MLILLMAVGPNEECIEVKGKFVQSLRFFYIRKV